MFCSQPVAGDAVQNIRNDVLCLGIMLEIMFIYCAFDSWDLVVYLPEDCIAVVHTVAGPLQWRILAVFAASDAASLSGITQILFALFYSLFMLV